MDADPEVAVEVGRAQGPLVKVRTRLLHLRLPLAMHHHFPNCLPSNGIKKITILALLISSNGVKLMKMLVLGYFLIPPEMQSKRAVPANN